MGRNNIVDVAIYHDKQLYRGKYDVWTSITSISDFDNVISTTNYIHASNYINYPSLLDSYTVIKVEDD